MHGAIAPCMAIMAKLRINLTYAQPGSTTACLTTHGVTLCDLPFSTNVLSSKDPCMAHLRHRVPPPSLDWAPPCRRPSPWCLNRAHTDIGNMYTLLYRVVWPSGRSVGLAIIGSRVRSRCVRVSFRPSPPTKQVKKGVLVPAVSAYKTGQKRCAGGV